MREGTLGEYLVRTVGWRTAPQVLGLLWAWGMFVRSHGRAPSIYELAGDSRRSQAQWYRDQQAFLRAFPDEESPDRIARILAADLTVRHRGPAAGFSVSMGKLAAS